MEFFDAIAQRFCHKAAFRPDPVPDAHLRQIVEAGMHAPSPDDVQACESVIVNDPDTLRRIGEIGGTAPPRTAPAMIVLVADHHRPAKGSIMTRILTGTTRRRPSWPGSALLRSLRRS